MGYVLAYERVECRGCKWFTKRLHIVEKLRLPPNINAEVIGKCKRKLDIVLRNSRAPVKHCSTAEPYKKPGKKRSGTHLHG